MRSFGALLLSALCAAAHAFGVAPIRLDLDRGTRSEIITVSNDGDAPISLQVHAMQWLQDESGVDRYLDTLDLVYFPQQFSIPAGETRVVRVGYRNPLLGAEKTYRVYIEQRSARIAADSSTTPGGRSADLAVTIRFGVPVFLRPDRPQPRAEVSEPVLLRGVAQAEVRNAGNVHFRISAVQFTGFDTNGAPTFTQSLEGWYLLSGAARRYRSAVPPETCRQTARLRIEVLGENLGLVQDARIAADSCP
jgi:fimbrial chaperone protein